MVSQLKRFSNEGAAMPIDPDPDWWRDAVVYQVYPRSFADGNGDGVGDLPGLVSRLPHLAELGVDALWISPWYRSPMADAGYDVADYRDIDPLFGTLADADKLLDTAHGLGLRVIIDIVPNHCSDQHPWFRAAVAAGPGSAERERFHFRPGGGADGGEPPNDWPSAFGGPAWTRVTGADGVPEEWYLHLFSPGQPDLNWDHPEVRAEFESILRFWFERGVDGFRIDVANLLIKQEGLPSRAAIEAVGGASPHEDRPEVHDVYRAWRRIANSYVGTRIFVGELWVSPESLKRYLRPDELHTGFNFPYLQAAWQASDLRSIIDGTIALHAEVGAPPTWVLGNHDVTRVATRYGREVTSWVEPGGRLVVPTDLELGTRRARAAALLYLALPGCAYVYQGEELGLWEVEDIPAELRQDPTFFQTEGRNPGRDGCRVPLPWEADEPWFGFGTTGVAEPWLPQPEAWHAYAADAQAGDPRSMMALYGDAIRLRRSIGGELTWVESSADVLRFRRGSGFECVVNFGREPAPLPAAAEIVLGSAPIPDAALPADTAVWLRR
jgi:alpha-glucosidase